MTKIIALKLTQQELDLLDALVVRMECDSRSAALRFGLHIALGRAGLGYTAMQAEQDRQTQHRRRRSRAVIDRQARGKAG